jgi:hypothetical protein
MPSARASRSPASSAACGPNSNSPSEAYSAKGVGPLQSPHCRRAGRASGSTEGANSHKRSGRPTRWACTAPTVKAVWRAITPLACERDAPKEQTAAGATGESLRYRGQGSGNLTCGPVASSFSASVPFRSSAATFRFFSDMRVIVLGAGLLGVTSAYTSATRPRSDVIDRRAPHRRNQPVTAARSR